LRVMHTMLNAKMLFRRAFAGKQHNDTWTPTSYLADRF